MRAESNGGTVVAKPWPNLGRRFAERRFRHRRCLTRTDLRGRRRAVPVVRLVQVVSQRRVCEGFAPASRERIACFQKPDAGDEG